MLRKSQDKQVSEHGNFLLNLCKATGFRILNGRTGADKNLSNFTCIKE
jgi:hypothetical protein